MVRIDYMPEKDALAPRRRIQSLQVGEPVESEREREQLTRRWEGYPPLYQFRGCAINTGGACHDDRPSNF